MELRQRYLELQRSSFKLKTELSSNLVSDDELTKTFLSIKTQNLSSGFVKNRFYLPALLNITKLPKKREDRYDYDFFTRSLYSSTYISPRRGLEGYWKRSIIENVRQAMDEINKNSIERGRLIDFKDVLYGYVKQDPLVGLDYIIDILLVYRKYEGRKMTVPVRRHAYVRNTFTTMLFREDNLESSIFVELPEKYKPINETLNNETSLNKDENQGNLIVKSLIDFLIPRPFASKSSVHKDSTPGNEKLTVNPHKNKFHVEEKISSKTIHFVVPLTGRLEIFERFMFNYEEIVLKSEDKSKLVVVLFENETDLNYGNIRQSDFIREMFRNFSTKYKLGDKSLNLLVEHRVFSRSIGCELGAALFDDRDLIFFVDVDILFTQDFLLRARLNTIEFKQVYYPIVFSEYDPNGLKDGIKLTAFNPNDNTHHQKVRDSHFNLNSDDGYWRQFGFGILVTYYGDLKRVGGFDKSIIGWGKEDVDLYEKYIKSNLTLFRTADPGLTHVFHKINCDPNLAYEQMLMCLGSKATSIASQRVLSDYVYKMKSYLVEPKLNIKGSTKEPSVVNRVKKNVNSEKIMNNTAKKKD